MRSSVIGLCRARIIIEDVADVMTCYRAVTRVMIRGFLLHPCRHRAADLDRQVVGLFAYAVGTIVARAALDGLNLDIWYQAQHITRLRSDILYPLMAGDVIRDLADAGLEVCLQQSFLVALGEVFERIIEGIADLDHIGLIGIHQRQFLFEHQCARRYR